MDIREAVRRMITFWSLLAADNPALAKSQVLPKLRLRSRERETDQHEEELHVELRSRAGLETG